MENLETLLLVFSKSKILKHQHQIIYLYIIHNYLDVSLKFILAIADI